MARRLNPAWFVVAGVVAAVVVSGFYLLGPRPRRVVSTEFKPIPTGTVNILIVGKDARAVGPVVNEGRQRNKREEQSHSDIVIICHINLGGKTGTVPSQGPARLPGTVPALPAFRGVEPLLVPTMALLCVLAGSRPADPSWCGVWGENGRGPAAGPRPQFASASDCQSLAVGRRPSPALSDRDSRGQPKPD